MAGLSAPLGVYIHWPYCARICPYCDFNVVRHRGRTQEQAALVQAIAADLKAHAALTGPRRLASIFFGGGTPSLMDPRSVEQLIALATAIWTPESDLEIGLEANPTDAEATRFKDLAEAGINRLSLGVQALDDASWVATTTRRQDDGRRPWRRRAFPAYRLI
jgi:oxygen-independent coproporphyrinogen-3 oxidase